MKMIASQYRESARHPDHPMNQAISEAEPDRRMKKTPFDLSYTTVVHSCDRENEIEKEIKINQKIIHTATVQEELQQRPLHALLGARPPEVHHTEEQLPRETRRTLAQLRAQKCPLLQEYLHSIGAAEDPSCPLCGLDGHNTAHLFSCPRVRTTLSPIDLWRSPTQAAELVQEWKAALATAEEEA